MVVLQIFDVHVEQRRRVGQLGPLRVAEFLQHHAMLLVGLSTTKLRRVAVINTHLILDTIANQLAVAMIKRRLPSDCDRASSGLRVCDWTFGWRWAIDDRDQDARLG